MVLEQCPPIIEPFCNRRYVPIIPAQRDDTEVALPAWPEGSGLRCHGDEGVVQTVVLIVYPCYQALMPSVSPGLFGSLPSM